MYNEILNLKSRLDVLDVNFEFGKKYDGYFLIVKESNDIFAVAEFSIIQHKYSRGLELCDFKYNEWYSNPDAIQGFLTVDETLKIMGI